MQNTMLPGSPNQIPVELLAGTGNRFQEKMGAVNGMSGEEKKNELRKVSREFEAVFIAYMLKVMREKCQILIAFGSCSCFGGIPGLANFSDIEECYDVKFRNNKTVKDGKVPYENLPGIAPVVKPNSDYVDIDIYLPGCV